MFKTLLSTLVILLALGTTSIEAKTFSYSQVHNMPRSVEKDYYIWRFLQQRSTTASQARTIIKDVDNINKKLRIAYKKKTGANPPNITHKPYVTEQQVEDWKHQAEGNRLFDEGIKQVQRKKLQKAITYFHKAHDVYLKRWEKDKSLFWLYLLTKEKKYLYKIKRNSTHINMYTLLAADITHSQYPKSIITPRVSKKSVSNIDVTNPIHWAKLKIKVKKPNADLEALAEDCESQATIGMNTYIKAKACNYRKSYFPMPYRSAMQGYPVERQALIYSIARQESRFVPASVSRSFALGMMQFMPFLIDHIAKQKGIQMDYDDMFKPKVAIRFADYHLDYLNKYLYHPLFVAYAYNGGIGFTKKLIRNRNYFRNGPFEPYLSMEKMTNVQAREYGKRVLTNYVIYMNKLGKSTRLLPYIKSLTDPSKTDKFR
ncbi:transglycosylase SLT domain-containing protein [Sulfurovum sp. NBC37-1]|uniref:transglycosylase SLT domain-containing protein n=1 Tax=Sulfurovum sp. (strain NBC37-1) TaxID=387093 RepID=UPI00015874DA|nr:transglycosylase SLT domain-containing protein [Sulfurovum sp. NBC37-1]BAF72091.1 lytic murein transglycosylase [Sulfurovum sp. NBC37-1]